MRKKYAKALWWVKRDFRLVDNEAFKLALDNSEEVLPCFCYEPLLINGPDWGPFHTQALYQAQTSLRKNLQTFGSDMYISIEEAIETFEKIHSFYNFSAIYAYEETGLNHTFERDKNVARWCREKNIAFVEVRNNGVIRKLKSRDTWEQKFKTFITSPQSHIPRELALDKNLKNKMLEIRDPTKEFLGLEKLPETLPIISEAAARDILEDFLSQRSQGYSGGISAMNKAVTHSSHLSVHLAWGTISLKHVFQETEKKRDEVNALFGDYQWEKSLKSFKSRLYWHAHFVQKLEDEVSMEFHPQNRAFENALPYVEEAEEKIRIKAWQQGKTGFPMIDASMRYYQKHGWLNFRSRSMVASFALHALRIDWRVVMYKMAPFMIDYVPGIHVAQIQMQAGLTGGNTIRIYSPMKQMKDHDPHAIFIKENIDELKSFSAQDITDFTNKSLGDYPKPIIGFEKETKIMKDALYEIKKSTFGKLEAERVYQKHGSRMKHRH